MARGAGGEGAPRTLPRMPPTPPRTTLSRGYSQRSPESNCSDTVTAPTPSNTCSVVVAPTTRSVRVSQVTPPAAAPSVRYRWRKSTLTQFLAFLINSEQNAAARMRRRLNGFLSVVLVTATSGSPDISACMQPPSTVDASSFAKLYMVSIPVDSGLRSLGLMRCSLAGTIHQCKAANSASKAFLALGVCDGRSCCRVRGITMCSDSLWRWKRKAIEIEKRLSANGASTHSLHSRGSLHLKASTPLAQVHLNSRLRDSPRTTVLVRPLIF